MNEATKSRMKKIMYEDILNTPVIDQIKILKNIAILEKEIFNSLQSGSKDFYKPLKTEEPIVNPAVIFNEITPAFMLGDSLQKSD